MLNVIRIALSLAAAPATATLGAQSTAPASAPAVKAPVLANPGASAAAPAAVEQGRAKPILDFQDQPLRLVLQALAEAGGVNLSLSAIPTATITLHMSPASSKAEIINNIKAIADANGIKWAEPNIGTLILSGPPAPMSPQQQQAFAQAKQQAIIDSLNRQSVHVYQLKHNNAAALAPVLTTLFQAQTTGRGGGGGLTGQTATPNGTVMYRSTDGTTTTTTVIPAPVPARAGGGGGNH